MQRSDLRPIAVVLALVLTGAVAGCGGDKTHSELGPPPQPAPTPSPSSAVLHFRVARLPGHGGLKVKDVIVAQRVLRGRLGRGVVVHARAVDGSVRIDVTLPDRAAAARARRLIVAPGRLAVYDWEASVVGQDGRHHPRDEKVTGGMQAGQPGAGTMPRAQAARIARRVPGAIVVRAESDATDPAAAKAARDAYFVLAGPRLLTGADLRDVAPATDSTTGQPDVTFNLGAAGRSAWRRATRVIARRGAAMVTPDAQGVMVAQHFAVVLDDQVISVPYIDPQQNPDGIDASDGAQISSSFTLASARALAALLRAGPLPVKLIPE